MPQRLHRITQGEDYRRIVRQGRRVGGSVLVTHAVLRTPEDPARFGFIVSKRVGNAVTRNLITRRLRGIVDELVHEGARGYDVVFRVQPGAAHRPYQMLREEARRQIRSVTDRTQHTP